MTREKTQRAEADKRAARGAAAVLAFALDMAPEAFFRATRGSGEEAQARQILLVVLRRAMIDGDVSDSSLERLGAALGRHRSTVSHALMKIEALCEQDARLDAFVDDMASLARRLIAVQVYLVKDLEDGIAALKAEFAQAAT